MSQADFEKLRKFLKANARRIRDSKAQLRKQLSHPDRRVRMRAYKFLRYRLNRGMR
jgi:hypothetical protein